MNKSIASNFDKAASSYNQHAHIQNIAAKSLASIIIPLIQNGQSIIEIGCGTGLLTQYIPFDQMSLQYIAADISMQSLIWHKSNIKNSNSISYVHTDCSHMSLKKKVDWIISSFSLHWMPSFHKTLQEISKQTKTIAFTIPIAGTLEEIKTIYKQCNIESPIHDFITQENLAKTCTSLCNKSQINITTQTIPIHFHNIRDAFLHFKYTGTNGYADNTTPRPVTISEIHRLTRATKQGIDTSYQVAHCVIKLSQ